MKGIILAGGSGTRLYPITQAICKQLMPIYDKPMIYYPISTLLSAGIREILIITTPHDSEQFERLLGDGSQIGCHFEYKIQDSPRGLADAYIVGEDFIRGQSSAMILGDNIFHGAGLDTKLQEFINLEGGAVFATQVTDPERYAVVEFDDDMKVLSIEEKPKEPKSNYAIPGLYFFDKNASDIAKNVQPSARGEIEITEVQNAYLRDAALKVGVLDRGTAWLDTGTFGSMMDASNFVEVMEKRTGLKIGCIEEVAWRNGFIDDKQLEELASPLVKSGYGKYLLNLLEQ
jgi:glucose-1-phosphate thymidylyltransferase